MSDRTLMLTVVLNKDYRIEDDAKQIGQAIMMIRGVASVRANVADPQDYMAIENAKRELREKIGEILK